MHLKTPPNATSSPNIQDLIKYYVGSFVSVMSIALFIAANIVFLEVAKDLWTSGDVLKIRDEKNLLTIFIVDCFLLLWGSFGIFVIWGWETGFWAFLVRWCLDGSRVNGMIAGL